MKKYRHRVERKREPQGQPLPKEVIPTGTREYMDRWGDRYLVIWNDQPGDRDLRELSVNVLK